MLPLLLFVAASGQDAATPSAVLARLPEGVARPVLDGRLDDEAWTFASELGPLIQVEPDNGQPVSERTEVLLLHDERGLFIGLRCFDSNPKGIRATQMQRDANLNPDDRVEIYFDTFLDRRNAFWFQIGPGGSIGDALITKNGSNFNKDFDAIWDGRARITDEGWMAEIAIPAASLNFDPASTEWGFNVRRHIRRKNEVARWASPDRRFRFFAIAQGGTLTGVQPMRQGVGLDVTPFVVTDWGTDRETGETDFESDFGVDSIYRITPSTKLTLSVNTDFAETEVDARVVNLTRFPVFFPERRDFFLEDAGNFFFGPSSSGNDVIPFFSRRIGLDENGGEVPITAAAKITGSTEKYTWGAINVLTGETDAVDEQNLFVGRFSGNFWEQSDAGVILTTGDPEGLGRDATFGADMNLRTDSFLGNRNLRFSAAGLATTRDGSAEDGLNYHLGLDYPNDILNITSDYTVIEDNFDPALGFVRRTGIKEYSTRWRYRWRRVGPFRWIESTLRPELITDTSNRTKTVDTLVRPVSFLWETGEELSFDYLHNREVLDGEFEIQDGVIIPDGAYTFGRYGVNFESSSRLPFSVEASYFTGDFFDGKRDDTTIALDWRTNKYLILGTEYQINDVELPAGDFTVRTISGRANFLFTPNLSWTNFAQYDNVSDDLGLNTRVRWILSPGRELNFVINQSWRYDDETFRSLSTGLTAKLNLTMRF